MKKKEPIDLFSNIVRQPMSKLEYEKDALKKEVKEFIRTVWNIISDLTPEEAAQEFVDNEFTVEWKADQDGALRTHFKCDCIEGCILANTFGKPVPLEIYGIRITAPLKATFQKDWKEILFYD